MKIEIKWNNLTKILDLKNICMYVVLREKIQKGISQKNRIQDTMNPWTYSYAKSQPLSPSFQMFFYNDLFQSQWKYCIVFTLSIPFGCLNVHTQK